MWKEAWLERGGVVKEGRVEDERLRGFSEQALKHFVAVGELDGQPCHDIDIFISCMYICLSVYVCMYVCMCVCVWDLVVKWFGSWAHNPWVMGSSPTTRR